MIGMIGIGSVGWDTLSAGTFTNVDGSFVI